MTDSKRFIGWGSVPSDLGGRIYATKPLLVVELDECRVTVRLRWMGRIYGAVSLAAGPGELESVYPLVKNRKPDRLAGVGFRSRDHRDWYFFTSKPTYLLAALRECGYSVSDEAVRATFQGRIKR